MVTTVVAALGWAPDGPLPKRLVAAALTSLAGAEPPAARPAAPLARTLPDGTVCLLGAPEHRTERQVAIRVADGAAGAPLDLGADGDAPGRRILEALGAPDGAWTVLELLPGPPDRVQARRIDPQGASAWRVAATAGSGDALRELVGFAGDAVLAVALGPPPRLVTLTPDGAIHAVRDLPGADGRCFADGAGRLGHLRFDPLTEQRAWVVVDPDGGRAETALAATHLDRWVGMDAGGRPFSDRGGGTIVRFGAGGAVDLSLTVPPGAADERRRPALPAVTDAGAVDVVGVGDAGVAVLRLSA